MPKRAHDRDPGLYLQTLPSAVATPSSMPIAMATPVPGDAVLTSMKIAMASPAQPTGLCMPYSSMMGMQADPGRDPSIIEHIIEGATKAAEG